MMEKITKLLVRLENWMLGGDSFFLVMGKFILVGSLFLVPIAAVFSYMDNQNPHIVLNKSEWVCTHTHKTVVPILVGKVIFPVEEDVCDSYRMAGYE